MSRRTPRSDARRRLQRGAIQFAVPSVLILTILVGALAVDVGRIAWNKRELQSVVDVGAIDAMRAFGQCVETSGDPVAAAQASALRNGYSDSLATAPNAVEIGSVATGPDGVRVFTGGGEAATATAVRVFATREVPFTMIASSFLPGSAVLSAEGVAAREAIASISAGSFAARVNTADSPLLNQLFSGLLGGAVALDALSYQNLLGASVALGDLVAAAGVGSVDELLALELTASDYLELVATALSDGGETSAAASLDAVAAVADGSLMVPLGDVLDIAQGVDEAGHDARLNAFDLLDVGAQVARGDTALVLDPLAVTVPGVVSTSARIRIVQSPRIAVGPPGLDPDGEWYTAVRTGQIRMAITARLASALGGLLGSAPVSLDLFVDAAPTVAHLDAIDCADASDPIHRVLVGAEPGLVRMGIGRFPDFESSVEPEPSQIVSSNVPLVGTVQVTGSADMPFQSPPQDLRFDGPFVPAIDAPSEDNIQTVGTPVGDSLTTALTSMLSETELEVKLGNGNPVSPIISNPALALVTNALAPVLSAIDAPVTSLFNALGITLGGADVTILSLEADQPALAR